MLVNSILDRLVSLTPLQLDEIELFHRLQRSLTDVTIDEFFAMMMDFHLTKTNEQASMIINQRITEFKQLQVATIARMREGLPEVVDAKELLAEIFDDDPFEEDDDEYENEDDFIDDDGGPGDCSDGNGQD